MQFTGGRFDLFGPRFFLEANGKLAADIAADVIDLEYEDDAKKSDQMTITVANHGLKYIDDPRFAAGATFKLRFGYANDVSATRVAVIKKAEPDFPRNGFPTMTLIAFDLRLELNRGAKPRNWGAVSTSDIAKKVAKEFGLKADIEESGDKRKQARVQTGDTGTWKFLLDLASDIAFDCYIEDGTLHFHKKRYDAAPAFTYTYFTDAVGTLIEFKPDVDMGKPPATTIATTDPKTGKSATSKTKEGDKLAQKRTGAYVIDTYHDKGKFVPGGGKVKGSHETNKQVADKHAQAAQSKIDMKAVKASMTVIGAPRLRARQMVRVMGVGKTYSGVWRVESTQHVFKTSGDVYVTKCKLSRNALGTGKKGDKTKTNDHNDKKSAADKTATNVVVVTGNQPRAVFRR